MQEAVLFISPYPPPADGIASHTRNIARELLGKYEVHIIAPGTTGSERVQESLVVHRILNQDDSEIIEQINNIDPKWVFCQFAVSALGSGRRGAGVVIKEAVRLGIFCMVGYHEPTREIEALPVLAKKYYQEMIETGAYTIAFSKAAGETLKKELKSEAAILWHGTRETESRETRVLEIQQECLDKPIILGLGFIHRDKGTHILVEAGRELSRMGVDFHLLIAGSVRERQGLFKINEWRDKIYYNKLKKRAQELGDRARFIPYVADEDLGSYMRSAAVIVLPYIKGTQSGVAGLVIGSKRGAIISELPGLVQQFGRAGRVYKNNDPKNLAVEIKKVLEEGSLVIDLAAEEILSKENYAELAKKIDEIGLLRGA
jgi:glycosyltransferase involved in cell wall biosynthesis